jgi:replicative DNA helicase
MEIFNKITNGGIPDKTLNIILAGTNVGKSLYMVHLSASYLMQGKNVLYVTLEMAEEAIANRVDANLMNMPVNAVEKQDKDIYLKKINRIKEKTTGKLIVKEFPTSGAHVGHIRTLLQELKLKKNFVPDVIMVDYINIMASSRVKLANTNSYFYIKAIAEELRGLAVQLEVPIWSATQSNRGGQNDSDMDLTNTAESFGLPATADFMFAVIRTEELDQMKQLMIKQLKSRYGNKNYYEKFVIGVDVERMKLYDVEEDAQDLVQSDGHVGPHDLPHDESSYNNLKF